MKVVFFFIIQTSLIKPVLHKEDLLSLQWYQTGANETAYDSNEIKKLKKQNKKKLNKIKVK